MAIFPTTKTAPLDKDIAVGDAHNIAITTAAREQLSVVITALDTAIGAANTTASNSLSAETSARQAADSNLQLQINSEITNRQTAVTNEATSRATGDSNEITARSAAVTIVQNEIDGERSPLRATAAGTTTAISIASAIGSRIKSDGTTSGSLAIASGVYASTFPGASVDFQAGTITYTGGTPAASLFTVATAPGTVNYYTSYSIVLLATAPDTLLITWVGSWAATIAAIPAAIVTGGIPVAIVTVQANTANTATIFNVPQANITQFLASGSGSGGSGSGSPLDPQPDETFTYYTRSDFSVDKKQFFGSTTGTDQVLGLKDIVLNVGQTFTSTDLTGSQFRADQTQINQVQARILYNTGFVDYSSTVSLSIDGGNSFTAGAVSFPGANSFNSTYTGNLIEVDWSFTQSSNPLFSGGTANTTATSAQKIAAIINPTYRTMLTGFQMNMFTSATTGIIVGKLYSVTSGLPNTLIATSAETYLAGQDVTSTASYKQFTFRNLDLEAGTQYALAVEGSALNANLSVYQVTAPSSTSISSATGTTSYTALTPGLAYYIFGQGADMRLRITSGTASSQLAGFGVDYVSDSPQAVRGDASYESRTLTYTEASTGLVTLNGVRYTPGAHQLLAIGSNHVFTGPTDFTELSSSQIQFPANSFQQGDVVVFYNGYGLVDGSSQSLGKINMIYDAVVGSQSQVSSGYAQYTSLQSAINATSAGAYILLLGSVTENITLSKNVIIEGKGYSSSISGTVTVSGSFATIRDVRFGGNLTISGSGNFVKDSFIATTATLTNSGSNNVAQLIQG